MVSFVFNNASRRTRTTNPLIKSQQDNVANMALTSQGPHSTPHSVANTPMTGQGLEPPQDSSKKTPDSHTGGAESGAQRAPKSPNDHDLQQVAAAWPKLPGAVKAGIVAMVEATKKE